MMEVVARPDGVIELNNAHVMWTNFSGHRRPGEDGRYDQEGRAVFNVSIDSEDLVEYIRSIGIPVKIHIPSDPNRAPTYYIKVSYYTRNVEAGWTKVYLLADGVRRTMSTGTLNLIDKLINKNAIDHADMDIRLFEYVDSKTGEHGYSAWLNAIQLYQRVDRFASAPVIVDEPLPFS